MYRPFNPGPRPMMPPQAWHQQPAAPVASTGPAQNQQPTKFASYDWVVQCDTFKNVNPDTDDSILRETMIARHETLVPSSAKQTEVAGLISKVSQRLEKLMLTPSLFEAAQVVEIHEVGSFKHGTMISGTIIADLVVILKTLPTKEAVAALANKLLQEYRYTNPGEWITIVPASFGFEMASRQATVKCLIATLPVNIYRLDPKTHYPEALIRRHFLAIKHTKWFTDFAKNTGIKVLIRLLKDIHVRFDGLRHLTPRMIDILAHYVLDAYPNDASYLPKAFIRCFQLLAGGLFLPGGVGIPDPLEDDGRSIHVHMEMEEMDQVCYTSQTLLRVLSHGGFRHVLGLEGSANIATEMSVWGNTVVTASEPAFDRVEFDEVCEKMKISLVSPNEFDSKPPATPAAG